MKSFDEIETIENKEKIAIVVVGFNRVNSLKTLFKSLVDAKYSHDDIPLVVSIDKSDDQEVYNYVNGFEWPYGEKYVNIQNIRLGLKCHIFQCGDLTKFFKAVIILEDDSFVAPYFYDFAERAVETYGNDDKICGISLYVSHNNEYVNVPFLPINNGFDVFLLQDVQTRGECFTPQMWNKFKKWLPINAERDFKEVQMPERIKTWSRAWSKYYYAYMIESNTTFLYPHRSFVTNMGAVGEHSSRVNNVAQVDLEWGKRNYVMPNVSQLVRYDAFYCNEDVYNMLNMSKDDLCLDYYGFNLNLAQKRYILTYKLLPFKVVRSFGLKLYPAEMNIKMDIIGDALKLYDTHQPEKKERTIPYQALQYIYCKHNIKLMVPYIIKWFVWATKYKLRLVK